jgi:hypothetical protein
MSSVGYGILWPIDGPPPVLRPYGLLQAAQAALAGVRIVPDVDENGDERWLNGVALYPFPLDKAKTHDPCAVASPLISKEQGEAVPIPEFGAYTVYLPIRCTAGGIGDHAAFKARAVEAIEVVQGVAVANELATGSRILNNPHLADGNGTFPNGETATDVANAFSLLEAQIAVSGRLGLIHCSPSVAIAGSARGILREPLQGGMLKTINGTPVIPDAGYSGWASDPDDETALVYDDSYTPSGHADPADATEEWIYASGPIEIRRSEVFTNPDTPAEALDRGLGATGGNPNEVEYFAERHYLAVWDTVVQSAVLVDRCATSC